MANDAEFDEKYPLHVKLKGINGENLVVGDFLDFLEEHDLHICTVDDDGDFYPYRRDNSHLIGDFFEIDADALSAEKDRMLEEMRAAFEESQHAS